MFQSIKMPHLSGLTRDACEIHMECSEELFNLVSWSALKKSAVQYIAVEYSALNLNVLYCQVHCSVGYFFFSLGNLE